MENGALRLLAGAVAVILTILTWIALIIGGLALVLLIAPVRIDIDGAIDDSEGLGYELAFDWALGLLSVKKSAGNPWRLSAAGIRVMRFPAIKWKKKQKEKKRGKKKKPAGRLANLARNHFQAATRILDVMARAAFLRGRLVGRIGLPDPADTVKIDLLSRMLSLQSRRLDLSLTCEYVEQIIRIDASVRATLVLGYLGLAAGLLMLERQTRMMLRSLRHA